MSKENEILRQHKESLAVTRAMIVSLIGRLREVSVSERYDDEFPKEWKYLWGEKENVVSVLTKLTGLLVKVVPMEQQLTEYERTERSQENHKTILSPAEREIIRNHIKRFSKSD